MKWTKYNRSYSRLSIRYRAFLTLIHEDIWGKLPYHQKTNPLIPANILTNVLSCHITIWWLILQFQSLFCHYWHKSPNICLSWSMAGGQGGYHTPYFDVSAVSCYCDGEVSMLYACYYWVTSKHYNRDCPHRSLVLSSFLHLYRYTSTNPQGVAGQ